MDGVLKWFDEADSHDEIIEPNAVILSTVEGQRTFQRTVLAKNLDRNGITIFTNYQSRKGKQIETNPQVSILFPWHAMERQIFIQATVTRSPTDVSDEYFYSRPYESQAGAWASNQSEELNDLNNSSTNTEPFANNILKTTQPPKFLDPNGGEVTNSPQLSSNSGKVELAAFTTVSFLQKRKVITGPKRD